MARSSKRLAIKGRKTARGGSSTSMPKASVHTQKDSLTRVLTEQLAAKLESEVMLRKRGMIDPESERMLAIKEVDD